MARTKNESATSTKPSLRDIGHQRLQFEFTDAQVEMIDKITEEMGNPARATTIRNAINLLELMFREKKNGGTLAIKKADGSYIDIIIL